MNRDYEDETGRSRARSRKKPSARDGKAGSAPERKRRAASPDEHKARRQTAAADEMGNAHEMPKDDGIKLWNEPTAGSRGTAAGGRRAYKESPAASRVKARSEKSRKRRRIIAMIIAECFALLFIFGYAFVARRLSLIQRAPDFQAEAVKSDLTIDTLEKMEGYWTIALFGVDSRDSNVEKGTHSDVNMICNINEDTGEIKIVSVFRDSYLNIDDDGSYNKINLAYFRGGPTQAVKALNKNLDLDITDYVTFNWKAVAQGINILGGIDLELSKAEFHYINSFITETVKATGIPSQHLTHAGMNHLDGVQAVAYGRLRLMDSDYARTERQRKVIQLAFDKAKKADIGTLNQIIEVVFPNISSSMTAPDFIRMAQKISKYYLGETGGFPFARGDANMGSKGACVIPQTLETNVTELHQFLFGDENYTPTDTVKKISAKISADSGMYSQGKSIDHVSTEGGIIPTPKTTEASTTEAESETIEPQIVEDGIDLDGDGIADVSFDDEEFWDDPANWPTDADGNPVRPTFDPSASSEEGEDGENESDEDGESRESGENRDDDESSESSSGRHEGPASSIPSGNRETSSASGTTAATRPGHSSGNTSHSSTGTTAADEKPDTVVPTTGGNAGPGGGSYGPGVEPVETSASGTAGAVTPPPAVTTAPTTAASPAADPGSSGPGGADNSAVEAAGPGGDVSGGGPG